MKSVTILLPCLNEEKTLDECIKEIKLYIKTLPYKFSILVCDNNSTDKSINICKKNRVKYVIEKNRGYGSTLINGINHCKTDYAVMLDSDMSYNIENIKEMLEKLDDGYDIVIGNRGKGNIEENATPVSHKIGNKAISFIGNILFHTKIGDYNCGIRAFKIDKIKQIGLECLGMEFASEMIIKAKINKLKMVEVPADLRKDKREHSGHLNAIRDGSRHLGILVKTKYEQTSFFRYSMAFVSVLSILFFIFLLTCSIPNKLVQPNALKSLNYYYFDYLMKGKGQIDYDNDYYVIDEGEVRYYEMAYFVDSNHPLKSLIEMNCHISGNLKKGDIHYHGEYARYWQGPVVLIRTLSIFFTYKEINATIFLLFLSLLTILLLKLWQESKILSLSFLLTCIGLTFYVFPISVELMMIPIISVIGTISIIDKYKKNKKMDIVFLIMGILSSFFDFLTIETLSLTMPLFILVFLMIRDKKEIRKKDFLLYIVLWIIGYSLTFCIKWLIDIIYFGKYFITNILNHAGIRFYDATEKKTFFIASKELFQYFFPFIHPYLKNILLLIFAFNIIFLVDKKKNIYLLLVCSIPIIRFLVLYTHSILLIFFTYRAIFPIIWFMFYVLLYETLYLLKKIINKVTT